MPYCPRLTPAILFALSLVGVIGDSRPTLAEQVSFSRQVAPILVRRCLGCHDHRKNEGRYALHTFEVLLKVGDSEATPIVAGQPGESYLFEKLTETDPDLRMPQEDDPLSTAELELVRLWIEQGARFDGPRASDRLVTLLPPRKHPLPPASYRRPVPVFALQFSLDGKQLLTSGWHELLVWNIEVGNLQQRIGGLPQRIHSMAFSPDQKRLAVCGGAPGEYGEIRIVDAAELLQTTPGTTSPSSPDHEVLAVWEDVVLDVTFTADGKSLVAAGADHSLRTYDSLTHEESWRTTQHAAWVTAVDVTDYQFSERQVPNEGLPDFFTLSEHETKSGSHTQQLWKFPDERFIVREANWELDAKMTGGFGKLETRALTRITTTGIGKTYRVKRETISAEDHPKHFKKLLYLTALQGSWPPDAPASEFVISASKDRTAKVFFRSTGELFTTYKGHRREYGPLAGLHRVYGVQTEPGTRRVWSGGEGKHFHGWNPVTVRDEDGTAADMEARFAKEYSIAPLHHDFPSQVFSLQRHGGQLFAASADGLVKQFALSGPQAVFDVNRIATHQTYSGHADHLFALAVSPDGSLVAAAGFTGEVVIWNVKTGQIATRFAAAPGSRAE